MNEASPNYCHSQGAPQFTASLTDGRSVEVRCGCVVDIATRQTLAGCDHAAEFLLSRALLTSDQREWIEQSGRYIFPSSNNMGMSPRENHRMKYG